MKRKQFVWALSALAIIYVAVLWYRVSVSTCPASIFSWDTGLIDPENQGRLEAVLDELNISKLYQEFPQDAGEEAVLPFLTEFDKRGVKVYWLAGRAEWGLDPDGTSMKREIGRVRAINDASGGAKLAGILFDVEPYLTGDWDRDKAAVMDRYVSAMTSAYQYAKAQGVYLIACIPYWYDGGFAPQLETLISTGCDEVAIMNYHRADEAGNIETEVTLARKYRKAVTNITEFQQPGYHDLTEQNTYYHDGLMAAQESWRRLSGHFRYRKLGFSYHYFDVVEELLRDGAKTP